MTARLLNGKLLAEQIQQNISQRVKNRIDNCLITPGLAVVLLGEDPASRIYVENKWQACRKVGMHSQIFALAADTSEQELIDVIQQLNATPEIHGILVQLPLPPHINSANILEQIAIHKDVDGFHPGNLGRLAQGSPLFRCCTPYGIMQLLATIPNYSLAGQNAVIVGASNIVGKPMALELLNAGCTVTVCHTLTRNLSQEVQRADILVSATGSPQLIQGEWINPGAIVIDVGITRLASGKLTGDVDFVTALEKAAWITPVPGGVGPMTVASLLQNTLQAAELVRS